MKPIFFRHPGMSDTVPFAVPVPELADLPTKDLGRLILDVKRRLMVRDPLTTIERFYFAPAISSACWSAIRDAAMNVLHDRALAEHLARGCEPTPPDRAELNRRMAAALVAHKRTSASGLGSFLRLAMNRDGEQR